MDDEMLELAAESGCYMLSIGFESISAATLRSVHKMVNSPDKFRELVDKIHSYGILVFGLFMFGFDTDDESVFDETVKFNIDAGYDMCAYSVLTPYPGTLTWYEMQKDNRMVSYNWDNYDQGHIIYKPKQLTPEQLREGHMRAYSKFYSMPSIAQRFPLFGTRSRTQYSIYNLFFRRGEVTGRYIDDAVAKPTEIPKFLPEPPLMPKHRQWVDLINENNHYGVAPSLQEAAPAMATATVAAPRLP
jgi:radical SAM superfamily enzyme YgiQ (UPF0313 family)